MVWKREFRVPLIVLVLGLILCHGCGEITSTTEVALTQTVTFPDRASPAPTDTVPVVPSPTIPADLLAAVQIVVNAIEGKQPEMLRPLIGKEGVAPGGFAQGVDLKGYNNADEIVAAFGDALGRSNPVCEGFVSYIEALPDKAILVYRGVKLDWGQFGFGDNGPDHAVTLQLFNMPEGWRFVYITPFTLEWGLAHLGTLQACPATSPASLPTSVSFTEPAVTNIPENQLDLSTMYVQEWASTSPDGKWVAVGLFAFPKENIGGQLDYTRLMIFSVEENTRWAIIDKWEEMGLGFPVPEPLKWSQDGKNFYFTHRVSPDGCSAFPFFTDLQRVRLENGSVDKLLPHPATTLALSPDESKVAYGTYRDLEMVVIFRDLATGKEQEVRIDPGKDAQAGNLIWSPDGAFLALTLAIHPCEGEYGVSKTVWAQSTSIIQVNAATLEQKVLVQEDPRLFITWEWNESGTITTVDGKENSIWHLDVDTGEITRPGQ